MALDVKNNDQILVAGQEAKEPNPASVSQEIDASKFLFGVEQKKGAKISPFIKRLQDQSQNVASEAENFYSQYQQNKQKGDSYAGIVSNLLGEGASDDDKLLVAGKLANLKDDEAEFKEYVTRLLFARNYRVQIDEDLANIEDLKSRVLYAELRPGEVTADSLSREANQQARAIKFGTEISRSLDANASAQVPFRSKYGLGVNDDVAYNIVTYANADKDFHFATHLGAIQRNAVMDSVSRVKEHERVAHAAYRSALEGKELSKLQKSQIEKASANTSLGRNLVEFAGYKAFRGIKHAAPGIFGKNPEEDSRYRNYLKFRGSLISSHASWLSKQHANRYLASLKAQRQQLLDSGTLSGLEIQELDNLISSTEEEVKKINKNDHDKFAESLNGLNDESLLATKELTDEEVSMWKFRMLQLVLIASPFGVLNIMGPVVDIFGPILDGHLLFGEGLGQAINNIPFFGDIADFFELDKLVEFVFDDIPGISDITELFNEFTDSEIMQEFFGATSPLATGSPLTILAIAGVFSLYRADSEVTHKSKSNKVERDNKEKLRDAFKKFRDGLSKGAVETTVENHVKKQNEIIEKAFEKRHLIEVISTLAKAGNDHLKIFDKFKIKFKESADSTEEEITLSELAKKRDLTNTTNVYNLLTQGVGQQLDQMLNHVFAFESLEGNFGQKSSAISNLTKEDIVKKAKEPRLEYKQRNFVEYAKEKLGKTEISGKNLEDQYKRANKELVDLNMKEWQQISHVAPTPSPLEPTGESMGNIKKYRAAGA